ncbi:11449_t:CDS:1, partial [Cetraspora pellucida]
ECASLLHQFAIKLLAIVPHSASCEQLFSMLGFVKTEISNKLMFENLFIIGQLRNKLQKIVSKVKNKIKKSISDSSLYDDRSINIFFDKDNRIEKLNELEELDKELEVIMKQNNLSIIDKFFDFAALERDQKVLEQDSLQVNSELNDSARNK